MLPRYKDDRDVMWRLARGFGTTAIASLLVAGCGIFGDEKDAEAEPLELQAIEETLDVRQIWSESVGAGTKYLRVALNPSGDGNRIYAASYDGNVNAFDPENGQRIWRTEIGTWKGERGFWKVGVACFIFRTFVERFSNVFFLLFYTYFSLLI